MKDFEDLKKLEDLSIKISDLINQNKFENILELDLQRKKIIHLLKEEQKKLQLRK